MSALKEPLAPKKAWQPVLHWLSRTWVEEMVRARGAGSRFGGWLRTAQAEADNSCGRGSVPCQESSDCRSSASWISR